MQASETLLLAALRTQKRQPPATDTLSAVAAEVTQLADAGASFKTLATTTFDIKRPATLIILVSSEEVAAEADALRGWLEQKLADLGVSAVRDGNTFRIYGVAENTNDGHCFFFELTKSVFSTRCLLWKSSRSPAAEIIFNTLPSALLELAGSSLTMHILKAAKAEL